jgi:diguanylate cyclase
MTARSATLTPPDIARIALKRLGELGLPPTPENYARFYNAITTLKSPSDKSQEELSSAYQVLFRVTELLDGVSETTDHLMQGLESGSVGIHQSVDALREVSGLDKLAPLLSALIASTEGVCQTVTDSQRDLQALRTAMEKLHSELAINRESMERDPLTGTLHRQGLEQVLMREVKRAQRNGMPLTVALIDLDRFKMVNDQYGHLVGDKLLMHFVTVAKAVLRETDMLARFGGDEFIVLLPETDQHGARFVVDRLRLVAGKTAMAHESARIELCFSTGIAQLRADENAHAMLVRADAAMHQAKRAGRDQVCVAA